LQDPSGWTHVEDDGEPMTEFPTAALVGVLHSNDDQDADGPVYFIAESAEGDEVGLVLPHGFTSSDDGNEILDAGGDVVAVVGQEYGFGGGEYALNDEVWSDGPRVDSLWLTGTISERA